MIKATIRNLVSFSFMMLLTISFVSTVSAQNVWYGENIVIDGDFSGDTLSSKWVVEGTVGTASVINGELAFTNLQETPNQYDFQVNQPFSAEQLAELAKGGEIELTFDARTTAESKTFHVFLGQVGGDWARYWQSPGDGDVTVTNSTQTYTLKTDVKSTWDAMRIGFEVSTDTSSLFIDNVTLRRVSENVLIDGSFEGDTLNAAWTRELGTSPGEFSASADIDVVNGELAITNISGDGTSYTVQVFQDMNAEQLDSIYAGPYEISFDARTDVAEKSFVLYFGENVPGGGWTNFTAGASPTVTSTMTNYTYPVNVTETWPMMKLGFEVGGDNSSVFFDNVILRRVREITPDPPTFNMSTSNGFVTITVDAQQGATNFDVYFSTSTIDSLNQPGVTLVGNIDAEEGLTFEHTTAAPHPTLVASFEAHYAVVAKTSKGTESDFTTSSIQTDMSVAKNYAVELGEEAIGTVSEALLETGVIPEASALAAFFPEGYTPFTIDGSNKIYVNGSGPDTDEDISGKAWIGFDPLDNLFVIYTEITDDSLVFATEGVGAGGAWNYDSFEMGLGNYAPDSFLDGSDHNDLFGGDSADWQMRVGILTSPETGDRGFIQAYGKADRINEEVPNSATIGERTATGYRTLTVLTTIELAGGPTNDAGFDFPSGAEIALFPFQLSINDNDATAREDQVNWGSRSQDGNWWQDPRQWNIVAFVGIDAVPTSNEDETDDQPGKFSLDQNYPNPFNPTTNISFTLANSSNVTLEVFNMLGQKVATLLQGEKMTAGQHTQAFDASSLASGMYLYRLSTPSFVQSRKMMLIK